MSYNKRQSTGMFDTTGREIFEGDYVQDMTWYADLWSDGNLYTTHEDLQTYEVVTAFRLHSLQDGDDTFDDLSREYIVVGNTVSGDLIGDEVRQVKQLREFLYTGVTNG